MDNNNTVNNDLQTLHDMVQDYADTADMLFSMLDDYLQATNDCNNNNTLK